jgi:hypothetical protein
MYIAMESPKVRAQERKKKAKEKQLTLFGSVDQSYMPLQMFTPSNALEASFDGALVHPHVFLHTALHREHQGHWRTMPTQLLHKIQHRHWCSQTDKVVEDTRCRYHCLCCWCIMNESAMFISAENRHHCRHPKLHSHQSHYRSLHLSAMVGSMICELTRKVHGPKSKQ